MKLGRNMNFIIKKMEFRDINQVFDLGNLKDEFTTENGSFWTKEQLKKWIASDDDVMLVAESEGKIIGFSFYAQHLPTKKVTWENIYVLPEYRSFGVGSKLTIGGLQEIKKLGCKYVMCCINAGDQSKFAKYVGKFGFKIYGDVLWVDMTL